MIASMIIKQLSSENAKAVFELEKECFSNPWPLTLVETELQQAASIYKGFFSGEELIAYSANRLVLNELQILKIAVKKSERRKGIARQLMLDIFEEAVARGARISHLEVRISNTLAMKLYLSLGFKVVGERKGYYQENNENAVLMSLELIPK